jgi:hypothetical protein
MNEYSTEKFIEQYEHIKKLELLTDSELNQLKRKRAQFEVAIRGAKDVKNFLEYIKYESVLTNKFKQTEFENEIDGRALDRSMYNHIRDIYKQAVRKFPENKTLWSLYIEFAKVKYPNSVTSIYQQMLGYHHTENDYIDAANHEMKKQNYYVAINFLIQGMGNEKNDSRLVAIVIVFCSRSEVCNLLADRHLDGLCRSAGPVIRQLSSDHLISENLSAVILTRI